MNFDELLSMDDNVSVEDVSTEPVRNKVIDPNLYTINLADAKDGVYKARVRFLPNPVDVKKSILAKYTYWLTDANGENGIYVDDPSTIGEKSPIGDLYWKLKKSTNVVDQNLAEEYLNRNRQYFSLVQIIKDEQHPDLVGQVKVFRYGIKVKEKIDAEFTDEDGGNPFNIMSGREFKIEVKKSGGYQNYDACKFAGSKEPITIDGKKLGKTSADMKRLEALYEDAPSLDDYNFKPWSAELTEQVYERLRTFGKTGGAIGGTKHNAPKSAVEAAMAQEKEPEVDVDEDDGGGRDEDEIPYSDSGDDDDLLAGIDI